MEGKACGDINVFNAVELEMIKMSTFKRCVFYSQ